MSGAPWQGPEAVRVGEDGARVVRVQSLDARAGLFYWAPGPGFLGTYELVFVHTDAAGARTEIPVSEDG